MIKINKLSKEKNEEITNKIYSKLKTRRENLENSKDFKEEYKEIIDEIFLNCKSLIGEDIENVIKIYEKIRKKYPDFLAKIDGTDLSNSQKNFKEYISNIFNYEEILKGKFVFDFAESLNIEVCPYCNRNYVNVIYVNYRRNARPDLDHFFPKSKYPLLSLSINNLIPICSYCNRKKSSRYFSLAENIYPYNEGIDNINYFNYKYGKSMDDITVVINKGKNKKMDNNAEILLIDELYKSHKVIVKNIIDNSKRFNKYYLEEINNLSGIRKITEDDIKSILGYVNKNDIKNTSLGKLKNDIIDIVREFET